MSVFAFELFVSNGLKKKNIGKETQYCVVLFCKRDGSRNYCNECYGLFIANWSDDVARSAGLFTGKTKTGKHYLYIDRHTHWGIVCVWVVVTVLLYYDALFQSFKKRKTVCTNEVQGNNKKGKQKKVQSCTIKYV